MVNIYLGKFNEQGKPEGFMLEGVNYKTVEEKEDYIAKGWVQLTQDEWEYYTNNKGSGNNGTGYIRDPRTGKPVSAPPITYSKEQLADIAFNACQSAVSSREDEIVKASALGGQDDYVLELREEIATIERMYSVDLDKIEAGTITKPNQISNYNEL